jgi:hypothetical protein
MNDLIHFRTSTAEAEGIKKMALCEGLSLSEFLRDTLANVKKDYEPVELLAFEVGTNKKPEPIGVFYFKKGECSGAGKILQEAREKLKIPADKEVVICTRTGIVETVPFSDNLKL